MIKDRCPKCGSRGTLNVYYNGYDSLKWDEEKGCFITSGGKETEKYVKCSNCNIKISVEEFNIIYERYAKKNVISTEGIQIDQDPTFMNVVFEMSDALDKLISKAHR